MAADQVYSYPTHTRASHPGWYSRVTYLHTYPEVFPTWNGSRVYNMLTEQFDTSTNKKGNVQWPENYWSPGMQSRIKGCFLHSGSRDSRFNIEFGIADEDNSFTVLPNDGNVHLMENPNTNIPVFFELNIYVSNVSGDRIGTFSCNGYYQYEDVSSKSGGYNNSTHFVPIYGSDAELKTTQTTYPILYIDKTNRSSITLLNLTIEELGG